MSKQGSDNLTGTNRRQFLRGLTALMGATAASQFVTNKSLAVALGYQANTASEKRAGKIFTQPHMQILHDICAIVLPETDSPSAAELDVHGFIDHQLASCHSVEQQQQAIKLLCKIDKQSFSTYKMNFVGLSTHQQTELLNALEQQQSGFNRTDGNLFKGLKSLLVFGYFTTEVGATQVLAYQAVPGGFKGSIPYQSVGKTYGSLAFY